MGTITRTVEGNVASFVSAGKADIQSLKCYFTPTQSGTGDASPSNVRPIVGQNQLKAYRTGANLWGEKLATDEILSEYKKLFPDGNKVSYGSDEDGDFLVTGDGYHYDTVNVAQSFKPKENQVYTLIMTAKAESYTGYNIRITYTDGSVTLPWPTAANTKETRVFVTQKNKTVQSISMRFLYNSTKIYYKECFGIFEGEININQYVPYYGQTIPITFPVVGKNKLDTSNLSHNNWNIGGIPNILVPNTTYTYTINGTTSYKYKLYLSMSGYSGDLALNNAYIQTNYSSTFTTPSNMDNYPYLTLCGLTADAGNEDILNIKPQVELGSTATTYEPYSSNNTVYGGYVDLISGDIVAEQICRTFKGSDSTETMEKENTKFMRFCCYVALKGNGYTKAGITYCDKLEYQYHQDDTLHYYITANNSNGNIYAYLPLDFGDNDEVTFVASLYTPQLVAKLSSHELQTLVGHNNIWSNANDKVSVTYDIHETSQIIEAKKKIIRNQPHIVTASGAIANFKTDMIAPLKSTKIYFNPVQEGSGDPSLNNVRNINGWTGLNLYQSNTDLLNNMSLYSGCPNYYYPGSSEINSVINSNRYCYTDPIVVNNNFILSAKTFDTNTFGEMWIFGYDNDTFTSYSKTALTKTNTIYTAIINNNSYEKIRIVFGAIANNTITIPLNGQAWFQTFNTIPIDWTNNYGTVYGGYVDLITGEVYQEWYKVKITDRTWYNYSSKIHYYMNLRPTNDVIYNREGQSYIYSDTLTPRADGNFPKEIEGEFSYYGIGTKPNNYYNYIWTKLPEAMEHADANAWIQETYPNATLYYKLATPIYITTLTPQQLLTLRGTNNIWSTANGQTKIQYWTH